MKFFYHKNVEPYGIEQVYMLYIPLNSVNFSIV